jgi:hypothetical protein
MNLQQLMTTGIVDEWTPKIPCQITEIKETKNRTQANRQMTKCRIADVSMKDIGCWIYTDETAIQLNMSLIISGMLKEYQGKRYLDYCKIERVLPSKYTGTLPNASQTPQNAPQSTNAQNTTQTTYEDTEKAKNESICRQCAGKTAAEIVAALIQKDVYTDNNRLNQIKNDLLEISDTMAMYFIGGAAPAQETQTEDDIP